MAEFFAKCFEKKIAFSRAVSGRCVQPVRGKAANYLWRFPPRRLEAEAILDAMLAVSGDLDMTPGGPHPLDPWPVKKYNLNSPFHEQFDHNRRSVYVLTQRLFENSFLGLFDGPDTNQTTASPPPQETARTW